MNFVEPKPKLARYTAEGEIIKDHHYYAGNDISWNKSAVISTKMYPFYHKLNDENAKRVEGMNRLESYEKQLVQQLKRERVLQAREEGLMRHALKVKEREVIAQKCNESKYNPELTNTNNGVQAPDILDIVAKRANSFKHARSRDISWNFLDKASDKQVRQVVIPAVLKGEEEMLKLVQKQYNEELSRKNKHEQDKAEFRNKLRTELVNRHDKAFAMEHRIGTMSVKNFKSTTRREVIEPPSISTYGFSIEGDRASPDTSLERISINPSEYRPQFKSRFSKPDKRPSHATVGPFSVKPNSLTHVEDPVIF